MEIGADLPVYEVNGHEVMLGNAGFRVESHASGREYVVLIHKGESITVSGRELKKAIDACMFWRY